MRMRVRMKDENEKKNKRRKIYLVKPIDFHRSTARRIKQAIIHARTQTKITPASRSQKWAVCGYVRKPISPSKPKNDAEGIDHFIPFIHSINFFSLMVSHEIGDKYELSLLDCALGEMRYEKG